MHVRRALTTLLVVAAIPAACLLLPAEKASAATPVVTLPGPCPYACASLPIQIAKKVAGAPGPRPHPGPRPRPVEARVRIVMRAARRFLGVPYVYSGASRSGVDCSGFVMLVYQRVGISLDHFTGAQWHAGRKVRGRLLPGDLVFFRGNPPGHVGIYVGNGRYIHAPETGERVSYDTLAHRGRAFVGARRLLRR